jgi:hypothetical protein
MGDNTAGRMRRLLRVVIASPQDAAGERAIALTAIQRVNVLLKSMKKDYFLEAVDYKTTLPGAGNPHAVSQEHLKIKTSDLFICFFWRRFGMPPGKKRPEDGSELKSGTEDEFETAYKAFQENPNHRPRVLVYRKTDPPTAPQSDEDYLQYANLLTFIKECGPAGKHPTYLAEFKENELETLLINHLMEACSELENEVESELPGLKARSWKIVDPPGPTRNRYALIVGVNRFVDPLASDLHFCVPDALGLRDLLGQAGYTTCCLSDDSKESHLLPTKDNIEAALKGILDTAEPDDLVWLHFSCHGKLVGQDPYLLVNTTRLLTIEKSGIKVNDLISQLRASACRRVVLTLDACHTGINIGRDLSSSEFIQYAYDLAEGSAIISASTADQVSQGRSSLGHGIFTYFLLKGLKGEADRSGKGFVTVDDIKTYTIAQLRKWRIEHGDTLQEPNAQVSAIGDIILVDWRSPQAGK